MILIIHMVSLFAIQAAVSVMKLFYYSGILELLIVLSYCCAFYFILFAGDRQNRPKRRQKGEDY